MLTTPARYSWTCRETAAVRCPRCWYPSASVVKAGSMAWPSLYMRCGINLRDIRFRIWFGDRDAGIARDDPQYRRRGLRWGPGMAAPTAGIVVSGDLARRDDREGQRRRPHATKAAPHRCGRRYDRDQARSGDLGSAERRRFVFLGVGIRRFGQPQGQGCVDRALRRAHWVPGRDRDHAVTHRGADVRGESEP